MRKHFVAVGRKNYLLTGRTRLREGSHLSQLVGNHEKEEREENKKKKLSKSVCLHMFICILKTANKIQTPTPSQSWQNGCPDWLRLGEAWFCQLKGTCSYVCKE